MDESNLYHYALVAVIVGFFALGFVVLFVPVSFDDSSLNFIDGIVTRISQTANGVVLTIDLIGEQAIFLDDKKNVSVGYTYRFYEPTGDDLLFVTNFRLLS